MWVFELVGIDLEPRHSLSSYRSVLLLVPSRRAGNATLSSLLSRVQPLWEREEKTRKAGLSPVERLKEEGDEMYKTAKFEDAIVKVR